MSAPAAPAAYKLKANKTQLRGLVADYVKPLDWVPELPSIRDPWLQFSHYRRDYWFDWWPSPGVHYVFHLFSSGVLMIDFYDWHTPLNHACFHVSPDELSRRGMLTAH